MENYHCTGLWHEDSGRHSPITDSLTLGHWTHLIVATQSKSTEVKFTNARGLFSNSTYSNAISCGIYLNWFLIIMMEKKYIKIFLLSIEDPKNLSLKSLLYTVSSDPWKEVAPTWGSHFLLLCCCCLLRSVAFTHFPSQLW